MNDKTMTVGKLRAQLAKCPDELPLFVEAPDGSHFDCELDVVKDPNGPAGANDWILKACLRPTDITSHLAAKPAPAAETQPELTGDTGGVA